MLLNLAISESPSPLWSDVIPAFSGVWTRKRPTAVSRIIYYLRLLQEGRSTNTSQYLGRNAERGVLNYCHYNITLSLSDCPESLLGMLNAHLCVINAIHYELLYISRDKGGGGGGSWEEVYVFLKRLIL